MPKAKLSFPPIQIPEDQAATALGISRRTLFNLRRAGKIAHVLVGPKRVFYRMEELERFSKENQVAATPSQS